ncbi:hypothetical protein PR048_018739, partial [Dryococelus australis]
MTIDCRLVSKFRVLETAINCNVNTIDTLIKAVCMLCNYIKMYDGVFCNAAQQHHVQHEMTPH